MISGAQCRAARALLNLTQEELALDAQVARPTIADFESIGRDPMRNNLLSIAAALEARGVVFIPENDQGEGAGVRFNKIELAYSRNLRDRGGDIAISMKYRGKRLTVVAPRYLIDDMDRTNYHSAEERADALTRHMPKYLVATERLLSHLGDEIESVITLKHSDFPEGTF